MNPIQTYIDQFPAGVQEKLQELRRLVFMLCPEAEEVMSYQMPTYKWKGVLLHFAAYKNHIGLYPTPAGLLPFAEELKNYKHSKGAVQFSMDQELPIPFIQKIIKTRMEQNLKKVAPDRKNDK